MNTLLSLVEDFNQQWRELKRWEPITETSGAMCLAYRVSLIEKGNELLNHPNDMLLCTHDYVIACERACMLGCKKLSPIY